MSKDKPCSRPLPLPADMAAPVTRPKESLAWSSRYCSGQYALHNCTVTQLPLADRVEAAAAPLPDQPGRQPGGDGKLKLQLNLSELAGDPTDLQLAAASSGLLHRAVAARGPGEAQVPRLHCTILLDMSLDNCYLPGLRPDRVQSPGAGPGQPAGARDLTNL